MKTLSQFFILLCLIANHSFSQSNSLILVKAGENPAKVIPKKLTYRYEDFQNGKLYFPSGKSSATMRLNYNSLYDDLMFIDKKGDTLVVGIDQVFSYAEIGGNQFYHDRQKGYYEILQGDDKIKLVSKSYFGIQGKDASGSNGYGTTSGTTGAIVATRMTSSSMVLNQDVSYSKDISYFFLEDNELYLKANKSSLLKLFPNQKDAIKEYLKTNPVDFLKEEDLIRVTAYCLQLK
jgi:hypothetical protein